MAGPNINPEKPSVVKFDTAKEIGSLVTLIACRITMGLKLAVNNPNKTNAGIIIYKFEVNMLVNRIEAPIIGKYPPTNFSPSKLIRNLANKLAVITPELTKTIARPPRKSGAIKSFVNHKDDQ